MLAYRVVDLSDQRGQLSGHILASLGCDVVLVEPPGGSFSRRLAPFIDDIEGPGRSLWHVAYNRGKRTVEADLDLPSGREQLLSLLRNADVLIESHDPGALEALGLDRATIEAVNPALVHASITAFGSDGPKADWAATDLTLCAASGYTTLTGDPDRAPLRISLPQAFHHAAADAAGAILVALYERDHHSGLGQHVDLSAQHSMSVCTQSFLLSGPANGGTVSREAGGLRLAGLDSKVQLLWPCKDGQVSVTFLFGSSMGPFSRRLMEWVCEEGFCDEATRDKDWVTFASDLFEGREPISEYARCKQVLHDFFATKTRAELYEATFTRRVLIAPVVDIADLLASEHFKARDFWQTADVADRGPVPVPGAFARFSGSPLDRLAAADPPGAHAADDIAADWTPCPLRVSPPIHRAAPDRPLEGLKVLDFMWVFAGPYASRTLADLGATVVRIESIHHLDTLRTAGNFQNNNTDPDWALQFTNVNAGKLSLALDVSKPEAKGVIHDLVRWADVVGESFTPKTMRAWGLDYASLCKVRPDLIMSSSCLMGQVGPESALAGFGTMAAAVSGWFNITGWPDRLPCGPFSAYTDYVSPRVLLVSLLAALEHRRRTGEGQHIDLSQAEASLHLMLPAVLDYTVNGRVMQRKGNDDPYLAPHGIYQAQGEDQWVAVVVASDDHWRSLCGVLDRDDLVGLSLEERLARRRDLDDLIAGWTSQRSSTEVMKHLQQVGVPAHEVQGIAEAFHDPQLIHRQHFHQVPHAAMGETWVEGPRLRLSRTPGIAGTPPTLGEHSWQVLTEILGYDDDRAGQLAAAGIIE